MHGFIGTTEMFEARKVRYLIQYKEKATRELPALSDVFDP